MSKRAVERETVKVKREVTICDCCKRESSEYGSFEEESDDIKSGSGHFRYSWTCKYDGCSDDREELDFCIECSEQALKVLKEMRRA